METKVCVVTMELMQRTVKYLETRPFLEVYTLINQILDQCNSTMATAPEPVKEDVSEPT